MFPISFERIKILLTSSTTKTVLLDFDRTCAFEKTSTIQQQENSKVKGGQIGDFGGLESSYT